MEYVKEDMKDCKDITFEFECMWLRWNSYVLMHICIMQAYFVKASRNERVNKASVRVCACAKCERPLRG
jgi:hypothetical protein